MEIQSKIATQGGQLIKLTHKSESTGTDMALNVFLPSSYSPETKLPAILYLSGLTCTPNNASEKSNIFYFASKHQLAVVLPDTSPRNCGIEGEDENWDFGSGAGFYLNATKEPYSKQYRMYDYITKDLFSFLQAEYQGIDLTNVGIMGHSMGGFGAMMFYLKNPSVFRSCSAFAPICNPSSVPWGQKAFGGYLQDEQEWAQYDPCSLISKDAEQNEILIHVGTGDNFLYQLTPDNLVNAAREAGKEKMINVNMVEGYDHSYYFISSFMEQHIAHHLQYLR